MSRRCYSSQRIGRDWLASRDSFQKRQKEAARREKRQLKLDRRQGRQHTPTDSGPEKTDSDFGGNPGISDEQTGEAINEGRSELKPPAGLPQSDNPTPEP